MSPSETRTSKEKHLDMGCLQDELLRAHKSLLVSFLGKALSSADEPSILRHHGVALAVC